MRRLFFLLRRAGTSTDDKKRERARLLSLGSRRVHVNSRAGDLPFQRRSACRGETNQLLGEGRTRSVTSRPERATSAEVVNNAAAAFAESVARCSPFAGPRVRCC